VFGECCLFTRTNQNAAKHDKYRLVKSSLRSQQNVVISWIHPLKHLCEMFLICIFLLEFVAKNVFGGFYLFTRTNQNAAKHDEYHLVMSSFKFTSMSVQNVITSWIHPISHLCEIVKIRLFLTTFLAKNVLGEFYLFSRTNQNAEKHDKHHLVKSSFKFTSMCV